MDNIKFLLMQNKHQEGFLMPRSYQNISIYGNEISSQLKFGFLLQVVSFVLSAQFGAGYYISQALILYKINNNNYVIAVIFYLYAV